ncbi:hypothetical protein quinque_009713 [Culex quinquefasciatus]
MAAKDDKKTPAKPTPTPAPTPSTAAAASAKPQEKDPKPAATAEPEGFSLVIIVKSVELLDNDEGGRISIAMQVGKDHKVTVEGTVAELNERRSGNSVSIPLKSSAEFKKFLSSNELKVAIRDGKAKELAKAAISLEKLGMFEPPNFVATIVPYTVSLDQDKYVVGTIKLILKTDRIRSVICLTAEDEAVPVTTKETKEEDTVLYVVNDAPERRSVELREDKMRQMLICGKCDALKSPSEVSYQYELIDGILVNRELPRKDPDLDAIKRKIEQIEREALLYPLGKEQPASPMKEPEPHRFCKVCGGESITGKTCDPVIPRHSSMVPEPNFAVGAKYEEFRPQQPTEAFQNPSAKCQHDPNILCPQSIGVRPQQPAEVHQKPPFHCQHDPNYLCPQSVGVRFCQRCGINLDWLPLHSICPKCGHRPLLAAPATAPPPVPTRTHELTPSRLDSWMKDFEFTEPAPLPRRTSASTLRSASLDIRPCPMCRLRGGCCPDCQKRIGTAAAKVDPKPNSTTTQSSTSDSEMMARRVSSERPKTRQSLRDRFSGFPRKLSKATRTSLLRNVYGDGKENQGRRRSSNVSLDVEAILKQSDAQKRKFITDGVQSVELRKVESKTGKDQGCPLHSAVGIRRNHRAMLRRAKKQNRGKFSYAYGNRHPGIVMGHCECDARQGPVPPHMGWQWDVQTLGIGRIRKGWRPGAIRRPIKELMQHFLVSYPLDNVPVSRRRAAKRSEGEEQPPSSGKQKPTLQIVKRNGEYIIEMNPLKDSETLKTTQNPYLPCEPIRFKLAKDPKTAKLHQLRQALKVRFNLCECKDLESCTHRHDKEKKIFQKELRKFSKRLGLPKATSVKDLPSESESELDLEFTPPSALLASGVRKPDVVCTETQYCEEDYKVRIPADKVKCKPGREDSRDLAKASRGKPGRAGADKAGDGKGGKGGKTGKGKGTQGDSKAVGSKPAGKGAGKGVAGKGAETGGGDNSKTRVGGKTGSKTGVGAGSKTKISDAAKNKSGNALQKDGGPAVKFKNVEKRAFISKGCGLPPVTTCYNQAPCGVLASVPPAACYNPCYTMCPY